MFHLFVSNLLRKQHEVPFFRIVLLYHIEQQLYIIGMLFCQYDPLVHERLRPQTAILDSELLEELPRSLIADAGFDVLSHALEAVCHWMKRRREWISKVSFTDFVRRTNWMKHRELIKILRK